ncbi:C-terminal processing protease CtpA/Prc [Mucilaginibacter rubeus]|uniref:S41 family peptidase n=1 Tax=Mucilaginibacter rubeus TaxID=2027860 RepID=UPI003396BCCD
MKNIKILLLFISFFPSSGFCQWKAQTRDFVNDKTVYSIVQDKNQKTLNFLFPEYEFYDRLSTKAYPLIDAGEGMGKGYIWKTDFYYQAKLDSSEHFLQTDLYLENVGSLLFLMYNPYSRTFYSKTIKVTYQGYQNQLSDNLGEWDSGKELPAIFKDKGLFPLSDKFKLAVLAVPVNPELKLKVYAADLAVVHGSVKYVSLPPDFYLPQVAKKNRKQPSTSSDFMSEYISSSTDQEKRGVLGSSIYLSDLDDKLAERDLINNAVLSSVKNYPFYAERNINKDSALRKLQKIMRLNTDTAGFYNYVGILSRFLKDEFHDPHLGINIQSGGAIKAQPVQKVIRPLRAYSISNKLYVAAVFDERYKTVLPLGEEIIKIDQRLVTDIMDSLRKNDPEDAKNLNGEFLDGLGKHKADSTVLTVKGIDGMQQKVCMKYNGTLTVDENFKPKQCYFKMLDKDVAYYQISSWTLDVYRRFLNNWDNVKNARKVIIDLRGNGGGIGLSVFRLLSVFFDKPATIYKIKDFEGNYSDPLIIKSNQYYHLNPTAKLVVLCDKNTACASEIFIAGILANRANTVLIGSESTGGVLADRYDLNFPSKVVFYTDALIGKLYLNKFNCIETKGIAPTSLVSIDQITDLKPYRDKVLRTAISE